MREHHHSTTEGVLTPNLTGFPERFLRLAIAWGIKSLIGEHKLNDTAVSKVWHRTAYDIQTGMPIPLQTTYVEDRIARVLQDTGLSASEILSMQRHIHNEEACMQHFRDETQDGG